ncbi:MAG: aminotransferase class I/II-fold pyridoxal phosphate-dependent enzyme [bacterium]
MKVTYHPEAEELNLILKQNCNSIYTLLSEKGKSIYFPKHGIVKQGKEAKNARFNGSIGMAMENHNTPICLTSIRKTISLPPADIVPYAPNYGLPELRNKWKELLFEKNPSLKGSISLPLITNGLTHALNITGFLFLNPGDRIIVSDKYWGNYNLIYSTCYNAEIVTFNTFHDGFDTENFEKILQTCEGKQIILLNFPHNPTGYTITEKEAKTLQKMILKSAEKGNKIVIILDDAYFGLVYEPGIIKESFFSYLCDLHENIITVKIDGATKEYYAWGLRIGFITFNAKSMDKKSYTALENKTAGVIRSSISSVNHISQSLVINALNTSNYKKEMQEKFNLLKSRYLKVKEILKSNEEKYKNLFTPYPYNSGYFMCLKIKDGINTEILRKLLLKKYSIGLIAKDNYLRIAFSCLAKEDIPEVFEKIYKACKELDR